MARGLAALLVGAAAPLAGPLADRRGERLPTTAGFLTAGLGLLILGVPGISLQSLVTIAPLLPVGLGLGLGMLFAPVSRAALNPAAALLRSPEGPWLRDSPAGGAS